MYRSRSDDTCPIVGIKNPASVGCVAALVHLSRHHRDACELAALDVTPIQRRRGRFGGALGARPCVEVVPAIMSVRPIRHQTSWQEQALGAVSLSQGVEFINIRVVNTP